MLSNRRLPILLFALTGSCNYSHDEYTFVLCQNGSNEIIGYNSNNKSGGGVDSYGFPIKLCGSNLSKCMTFPFNFAVPATSFSKATVHHIEDFTISFEKVGRTTTARFVGKRRNLRTESTYDDNEGLTKYVIEENGKIHKYKKCKGHFYVRDMPQAT